MRTYLKLVVGITLLFLFSSCTKEDIHPDHNVLGVWETTVSDNTYILVFGENNTGLHIETNVNDSEGASSAVPFNWIRNNKDVVTTDANAMQRSYIMNADGQLVLNTANLSYLKVSNDYGRYY
ncbi:hypothetical protein [Aestuariivivens sediminicola]|uniref:hypothetical protein n=1 Tax=Aestuariivivens sediminicola TaxID=2913560 RepID=UPI001F58218D|nr:hypothetical protein [Aestuariivivens sediminicola]